MNINAETTVYTAGILPLADQDTYYLLFELLSRERQEKVMRLALKEDRFLSVGAGILLRVALADRGVNPDSAVILTGQYGKPYIDGREDIHFSLSHSGSEVMCAVSRFETGCDVEATGRGRTEIADRYFAPSERDYIFSSDNPADAFCRMWVLKESFLKTTGKGLYAPLDSFEIDVCSGKVNVKEAPGEYSFGEFAFAPGYRYACCVRTENAVFRTERIELDEILL